MPELLSLISYLAALIVICIFFYHLTKMFLNKFFGKRVSRNSTSAIITENRNLKIRIKKLEVQQEELLRIISIIDVKKDFPLKEQDY